jgi:hypothetical protein
MNKLPLRSHVHLKWQRGITLIGISLLFAAFTILPFTRAIMRGLNHDEHQFVAAGVLFAKTNLLPYRDYPYFHVPLQPLIYGWLYQWTDSYLFTARIVSMMAGWAIHITLFFVAWFHYRAYPLLWRFLTTAALSLLLLFTPLLIYTSGTAWNHELPTLFTIWVFLLNVRLLEKPTPQMALVMGILIGLASATRLTFALIFPAALFGLWFWASHSLRQKTILTLLIGTGALLGALPALPFLVMVPQQFLFGVVEYAQINTAYRQQGGYTEAMDLFGKFRYLISEVILTNAGSLLTGLGLGIALWLRGGTVIHPNKVLAMPQKMALLYLTFLLMGGFAPTPSWSQYFYPLIPFVVLTILYGLPVDWNGQWKQRSILITFIGIAGLTVLIEGWRYEKLNELFTPEEWTIHKIRDIGVEIDRFVPTGPVLTLAPILALEGGLEIYPFYVNGPFSVRAADFIPTSKHQSLVLIGAAQLPDYLAPDPPHAIVIGYEADDQEAEAALLQYATTYPYSRVLTNSPLDLYVPAQAEWEGAIRLSASQLPRNPVPAGNTFQALFYFDKIAPIEKDLNVLVRLVRSDGQEIARHEGYPWGIPTSAWEIGQILPDGHELHIPENTPPGYYRVEVSFYDPLAFESLTVANPWTEEALGTSFIADYIEVAGLSKEPTIPLEPVTIFEEPLGLDGIALDGDLRPTIPLSITIFWKVMGDISQPYTMFVHLVDANGQIVAQRDQPPLGGFIPMDKWHPMSSMIDNVIVVPPDTLAAGRYELRVGLYNPIDGERLKIVEGTEQGQSYVTVTTFIVSP